MTDRLLVLVRHGQSEWNLKNLFTGWRDVDLSEQGIAEARAAGRKLKAQGIRFDIAFTSALKRAQRTLVMVLDRHTTESILKLNLETGVPMIYRLNADSTVAEKRDLAA